MLIEVCGFICCDKILWQKQLGEERRKGSFSLKLIIHIIRKARQELEAGYLIHTIKRSEI